MSISLTILGSGTISHQKERGSTGLLLVTDKLKVLFDSGPGTLYRLAIAGISVHDIDMVCYTHNHPDHISDLVPLLQTYRWDPLGKGLKNLTILGPDSVLKTLDSLIEVFGVHAIGPDQKTLSLNKLLVSDSKKIVFEDLEIEPFRVFHTSDSLGYKVKTSNGVFVYSGDMGYCGSNLMPFKDADVIIIECSFPSKTKTINHLTPKLVKRITRSSKAKKIILNHIYPNWSEEEYQEIELLQRDSNNQYLIARDFMTLSIDTSGAISVEVIDFNF